MKRFLRVGCLLLVLLLLPLAFRDCRQSLANELSEGLIGGLASGLHLQGHRTLARLIGSGALRVAELLVGPEDPLLIRPLDQSSYLFAQTDDEKFPLQERAYRIALKSNAGGVLSTDYLAAKLADHYFRRRRLADGERVCRERIAAHGGDGIARNFQGLLDRARRELGR